MTKLEEKLIELGYELTLIKYKNNKSGLNIYEKKINNGCHIEVHYYNYNKSWFIYLYIDEIGIANSYVIENINITFNQMKNDLEILKGVEND